MAAIGGNATLDTLLPISFTASLECDWQEDPGQISAGTALSGTFQIPQQPLQARREKGSLVPFVLQKM